MPQSKDVIAKYSMLLCGALANGLVVADDTLPDTTQKKQEEIQASTTVEANTSDSDARRIEFGLLGGQLEVGGAMRVNYAIGDYGDSTGAPSRAKSDGKNFSLDTLRFNVDYKKDNVPGKVEYRFYNGYHFLHTGWLGYNFDGGSEVQVGVNRVPFGSGSYGVSQSWFFDQHYCMGLFDDMDLGVKYTREYGELMLDMGYYYSGEERYAGSSRRSVRYS